MLSFSKVVSYPNIASTVALVLATSGGAFAATTALRANSVGTPQLKTYAVTSPKLATNAVSSAKIYPGSVSNSKIAAGAVDSAKTLDNSLTSADIKNGTLTESDFAAGQLPAGLAGAARNDGRSDLPSCADTVVQSRDVTPRRASRLIVMLDGSVQSQSTDAASFDVTTYVLLKQGSNELGRTQGAQVRLSTPNYPAVSLSSAGLLMDFGDVAAPVSLKSGTTYTVEQHVDVQGTCGKSLALQPTTLTTLLTEDAG